MSNEKGVDMLFCLMDQSAQCLTRLSDQAVAQGKLIEIMDGRLIKQAALSSELCQELIKYAKMTETQRAVDYDMRTNLVNQAGEILKLKEELRLVRSEMAACNAVAKSLSDKQEEHIVSIELHGNQISAMKAILKPPKNDDSKEKERTLVLTRHLQNQPSNITGWILDKTQREYDPNAKCEICTRWSGFESRDPKPVVACRKIQSVKTAHFLCETHLIQNMFTKESEKWD